jgi:hypothetical protein
MSPRHLALIAAAVITLGGLVYVFVEVNSAPAASGATTDERPTNDKPGAATPATTKRDFKVTAPTKVGGPTERGGEVQEASDAIAAKMKGTIAVDEPAGDGGAAPNVELEHGDAMDEANKHYDRGDYESASKQALRILEKDPTNVRMLRIVVSSACLMGDSDAAIKYNVSLPPNDQRDMHRRCERYGITLVQGGAPTQPIDSRIPARVTPLVKNQ